MHNLDKAREWANRGENLIGVIHPDAEAAIEIIQSLPDNWVDVEKVRKILDIFIRESDSPANPGNVSRVYRECAETLEHLLPAKLPTLADMTEAERKACLWMQCKVTYSDQIHVIARPGLKVSALWREDGYVIQRNNYMITPLPDLPKLQWPGGVVDAEIVEEPEPVDAPPAEKAALQKPEDVPLNEPWLIEANGQKAIGTRYQGHTDVPWSVAALDGAFAGDYSDKEIALIHKLVPETTALPEGMRLADHEEYGRVVTSPWGDGVDDYKIFFLNEDVRAGADYEYANESTLTFLDGADNG